MTEPAEPRNNPDDLVARLIRIGATQDGAPDEQKERLRSGLRPHWRREVQKRKRRALAIYGAAGLAAALILFAVLAPLSRFDQTTPDGPPLPAAEILQIAGSSWIEDGSGEFLTPGNTVYTRQTVSTRSDSRASLLRGTDGSIRLDHDTTVYFESPVRLHLVSGRIYVDSGSDDAPSMIVRTSFGLIREIGTQFTVVAKEDSTRVYVRSGIVQIEQPSSTTVLEAGGAARVTATEIAPLTPDDELSPWAWSESVAPPVEIDGKPVTHYLAWIERETGLEVQFESLEAERRAETALLQGRLMGLSPGDSLEPVLATAGLEVKEQTEAILLVGFHE